jgi:hypothetical protein
MNFFVPSIGETIALGEGMAIAAICDSALLATGFCR